MSTSNFDELLSLYGSQDSIGAVRLASQSLQPTEPFGDLNYVCGAILIDRGGDIDDRDAIEKGIAVFTNFVSEPFGTPDNIAQARYNLANGFGALARHFERIGDKDERLRCWKRERDELQTLLLDKSVIPPDLLPNVLTNFANSLSQLGRKSEALDYYAEACALTKDHPVALGGIGQVSLDLLGVQPTHNFNLLIEATRCLKAALSSRTSLHAIAGPFASQDFENSLATANRYIEGMYGLSESDFQDHTSKLETAHKDWKATGPVHKYAQLRLLLTVNPFPLWCPKSMSDDLFFDGLSTKAGKDGIGRFNILAKTLNQIKEDFATARHQYLQILAPDQLTEASKVTKYADTLDYADFGLASGLLKASIRSSFDIFDKVANFLNRYLELDIPDHQVSISSVWYEAGKTKRGIEHPTITKHLNDSSWLRGIRDAADTMNFFPAPSRDIRNKATHDFLVIENAVSPRVSINGQIVAADALQFAKHLLLVAKGSIINLVAFVQRNESVRSSEEEKPRLPITFDFGVGISDRLNPND